MQDFTDNYKGWYKIGGQRIHLDRVPRQIKSDEKLKKHLIPFLFNRQKKA